MSETTIEKQTIYFPSPWSKWNHMGQHLGGIKESKPSGAVDPGEPWQPSAAPTEFYSMEKQVEAMFSWASEFPLAFFLDNC